MSARVLSDGLCLEEVFKYLTFRESRALLSVSRQFRESCRSCPYWEMIDLVGYEVLVSDVMKHIPLSTQCLRIDVRSTYECKQLLREVLQTSSIKQIEIYERRSDGSVTFNQSKVNKFRSFAQHREPLNPTSTVSQGASAPYSTGRFRARHLLIQHPIDDELISVMSEFGEDISSLACLGGVSSCDVSLVYKFVNRLLNIECLMVGRVLVDFDEIADDLLKLNHMKFFQADDLDISIPTIKRLAKPGTTFDLGSVTHMLSFLSF